MASTLLVRPGLGHWAGPWDRLVDRSPLPSPYLRSWWLSATAGPGRQFVLAVQGDVLNGGIALERRSRLGLPFFTMMGAGPLCPDHLDLLADSGHEDDVGASLAAWFRRPGLRALDLEGVAADSLLVRLLRAPVHRELLAVAPWTALPADPDAYLAARPASFRNKLRRAASRLAAEGASHRVRRGSSVLRSLDILRRLHATQWGDRSRFLPSFDRFAAACRLAAEVDEIAVHELAAGPSVIAIVVAFEVAGRVSLYQSARLTDVRWRDSLTVLLNAVILDACTRGFAEVDFLRGDEPYKSRFAPEQRQLLRLRVANGTFARGVLMTEITARRAKQLATRIAGRGPS